MHDLQTIKRLNAVKQGEVNGIRATTDLSERIRKTRDAKADKQRRAGK